VYKVFHNWSAIFWEMIWRVMAGRKCYPSGVADILGARKKNK
jgi:hypothetical protein